MPNCPDILSQIAYLLGIDDSGFLLPEPRQVDVAAVEVAKVLADDKMTWDVLALIPETYGANLSEEDVPVRELIASINVPFDAAAWAIFQLLKCDRLIGRVLSVPHECSFGYEDHFDSIKDIANRFDDTYVMLVRPTELLWDWFRQSPGTMPSLAHQPDDGVWSDPRSPSEWAKLYGVSPQTFKAWRIDGKIRTRQLSTKSYRVHLDDMPQGK